MIQSLTETVAAEIRAAMARRKLGPQDLADAIGVHRVTASKIYNGHVTLDVDRLHAICSWLEMDMASILDGAQAEAVA